MPDLLSDFWSEEALDGKVPDADAPAPSDDGSVTAAELLSRGIAIEWFEAVAISQAVCEQLRLTSDGLGPARIEPEGISIDASGGVAVNYKRKGGSSPAEEVAGLLAMLLPDRNVPTPLRLALSQAGLSTSLAEWSNAIGYYERPNRASLIKAVYERAMSTASAAENPEKAKPIPPVRKRAQRDPLSDLTVVEPAQAPPPKEPVIPKRRAKWMEHVAVVALALLVAFIASTVVLFIQTRSQAPEGAATSAGQSTPTATTAVGAQTTLDTAASVVGTLVNQLPGMGAPAPALVASQPELRGGRWIFLPSEFRLTRIAPLVPQRVVRSVPLPMETSVRNELADAVGESLADAPVAVRGTVDQAMIYSAADGDVVPPIAVYPRFPSTYPPGTTPNDFAEFEVIVTPAGGVESVKARRAPLHISEALRVTMSLSAAKTWRFRPGMKDGEPVTYRQIIRILNN